MGGVFTAADFGCAPLTTGFATSSSSELEEEDDDSLAAAALAGGVLATATLPGTVFTAVFFVFSSSELESSREAEAQHLMMSLITRKNLVGGGGSENSPELEPSELDSAFLAVGLAAACFPGTAFTRAGVTLTRSGFKVRNQPGNLDQFEMTRAGELTGHLLFIAAVAAAVAATLGLGGPLLPRHLGRGLLHGWRGRDCTVQL